MTTQRILEQILVPRPNGSTALERVGSFLSSALEQNGALVGIHEFTATPYGFQLTWAVVLVLMGGYVAAIATHRYRIALLLPLVVAGLLLLEFEFLRSPVSGLLSATERNIIGTYPGQPDGPTLIFSAHYDTTTHFGDHYSWGTWGSRQGPATLLAIGLASLGLWRRRRNKTIPAALALPLACLAVVPFAAMFWFQSMGPILRTPSPGAIDNGGSVAALVLLAQDLSERPANLPTTVKLVFLAAEEERALGSWEFAKTLDPAAPLAVINLESIGADPRVAYIPEDGFALQRYRSRDSLIGFVNQTARSIWGEELQPRELPFGTLTDGRSFLAHGVNAVTLRAFTGDAFPRNLHSSHDSRERISTAAIERTSKLLRAIVHRADSHPDYFPAARSDEPDSP